MKQLVHLKSTITPSARGAMRCPPLGRVFLFVAHLLACVALAPVAQAVCVRPGDWATYVASYSFTANWSSVNGATVYRLDVSTSSSFSTYVPGYQNRNVGNVTSRSVTGLNPSTAYYFRVRAYCNRIRKTSGNSNTVPVTTLSPTGPPVVITNRATYIASYSARLENTVDPHGLTTTVYFQYGTSTSYGLTTAIQSKTGDTYQNVVATIGGLTANTTYHFRIVATNSAGTRYGADQTFTTLSATGPPVVRFDFNGDGKTDYVLQNVSTRQTALWYLNNNTFLGGASGPTIPAGWSLVDVADFNGDGKPDYALFNPITRQTATWYMNNNASAGSAGGPTLPSGWSLVATGYFNNDSKPDYVLYNASTRQTAIWYLNNNVLAGGVVGPTLPVGWRLAGVADFNGDGYPDYLLFNSSTRQTAIWYLNNNVLSSGLYGPTLPVGWTVVGVADFNGDGKPDYLLYNASTRQTALWYMHNNVFAGGAFGPTLPVGWSLAAP